MSATRSGEVHTIAKTLDAELRALRQDPVSPLAALPEQVQINLRCASFYDHDVLDIHLTAVPERLWNITHDQWGDHYAPTNVLRAAVAALHKALDAHHHTNFYGGVNFHGAVFVDGRSMFDAAPPL